MMSVIIYDSTEKNCHTDISQVAIVIETVKLQSIFSEYMDPTAYSLQYEIINRLCHCT